MRDNYDHIYAVGWIDEDGVFVIFTSFQDKRVHMYRSKERAVKAAKEINKLGLAAWPRRFKKTRKLGIMRLTISV